MIDPDDLDEVHATATGAVGEALLRAAMASTHADVGVLIHQHTPGCDCGHEGPLAAHLIVTRDGFSREGAGYLIRAAAAEHEAEK